MNIIRNGFTLFLRSVSIAAALISISNATAQNVGIGTAAPQSKLSVEGNLAIGDGSYTSTSGTAAPTNGAIIEGIVGIGTNAPTQAPLVVGGTLSGSIAAGEFFDANAGTALQAGGAESGAFSIFAAGSIAAAGDLITRSNVRAVTSLTFSDARLKNIIGRSESSADLLTLEKLRVTDYTMKDPRVTGSGKLKKLVAQQVEEVYPQAVTKVTGEVPDIYLPGRVTRKRNEEVEISTDSRMNIKVGDRIQVFTPDGLPQWVVVEVAGEKNFTTKLKGTRDGSKVFVYGHQVNDLRTLDYDAISMLNVSATQELAKQVTALQTEVTTLKEENSKLKERSSQLSDLRDEINQLKKAIATSGWQRTEVQGASFDQ